MQFSISKHSRQKNSRRNFLLCEKPIQRKVASGLEDTVYRVKEILAYVEHQEKEDKGQP